jgi:aromatic ring-opening dioxygenase LigB subunit
MVVFGAIAPHGSPAFAIGSPTRRAFVQLGRRLAQAQPNVTVLVTPHNVHVDGAFAVVDAAVIAGSIDDPQATLSCAVDRVLAARGIASLRAAGIAAVGVSFGSNDPALAEMPLDWGTLIPLWFLGGRARNPRPVVVVSPARDRPLAEHVRAGQALASACRGRRAAFVVSADHGHRHDPNGPFGFDPAAAEYDARVVELVLDNRLGDALVLGPLAGLAYADSLWQLLVLHGALGDRFRAELLSYEVPTYFGMLCAAFEPRSARSASRSTAPTRAA